MIAWWMALIAGGCSVPESNVPDEDLTKLIRGGREVAQEKAKQERVKAGIAKGGAGKASAKNAAPARGRDGRNASGATSVRAGKSEAVDEPGKWRQVRGEAAGVSADQQREIAQLEAIGYADGTEEIEAKDEAVTVHDPERAFQGYNFYSSGHGAELVLTDMSGVPMHTWRTDFWQIWPKYQARRGAQGTTHFRRAYLYDNGDVLGIFEGRGLVKLDKDSEILWGYPGKAHHDLAVEGDKIYVLTREPHMVKRIDPQRPVVEDFITLVDGKTGTGLKRVSLIRAFENSEYDEIWKRRRYPDQDIFHTNTLEVLDGRIAKKLPAFKKGNILTSMRELSCLAVVDLEAEKVVWAHTGDYRLQHDPKILDNGNLLMFDNAGGRYGSRVIEFDPVAMEEIWSYEGTPEYRFESKTLGTAERLPNGNTLITEGEGGRAFEVTPDHDVVWEFYNPHRAGERDQFIAALFEVIRVPTKDVSWAQP